MQPIHTKISPRHKAMGIISRVVARAWVYVGICKDVKLDSLVASSGIDGEENGPRDNAANQTNDGCDLEEA